MSQGDASLWLICCYKYTAKPIGSPAGVVSG